MIGKNNPILSIGIPTFNRYQRLKELLETIVIQQDLRLDEWEIVISDNCSTDETKSIVDSFFKRIPNLRFHQNDQNIGPDANIMQLFDLANGDYVWIMPDDDLIAGPVCVRKVIDKITSADSSLTYLNLNSRIIQFDTNKILQNSIYSFSGDIYFSDGRAILNMLSDIDLLAANRLVIRKNSIKPEFSKPYCNGSLLSPLALSLAACSSGSAIVTSEIMTFYREGVALEWRRNWFKLLLQDMSGMLLDAVNRLGYSPSVIHKKIEDRKKMGFRIITPHHLIFQLNGLSWKVLSRYYGATFVLVQILSKLLYEIPKRIFLKILPLKNT